MSTQPLRILTVTPNPALDISGYVDRIVPNEKNYVERERRDPGGNGVNSARIAARLGAKVTALGFSGGAIGRELERLLGLEGVDTAFTPIRGSTRANVTVTCETDHRQTRLAFPGPEVTASEKLALLRAVRREGSAGQGGLALLGGSLPRGCGPEYYSRLIRVAASSGLGVFLDVPSAVLKSVLARSARELLFIKPNLTELQELLGRRLRDDRAVIAGAGELAREVGLVCVSLAERGAVLATSEAAWFGKPPRVRARGTVGAGDSLVGAMASRFLKSGIVSRAALQEALRTVSGRKLLLDSFSWGLAAGASTAESEGTGLGAGKRVRQLRPKARVEQLARDLL